MKKIVSLLSLSAFMFIGCNAGAQNNPGTNVGNPGSSNTLIIEEGYVVTTQQLPASTNTENTKQEAPTFQQPVQNSGAAIYQDITETTTPDSQNLQEDTLIIPNN